MAIIVLVIVFFNGHPPFGGTFKTLFFTVCYLQYAKGVGKPEHLGRGENGGSGEPAERGQILGRRGRQKIRRGDLAAGGRPQSILPTPWPSSILPSAVTSTYLSFSNTCPQLLTFSARATHQLALLKNRSPIHFSRVPGGS